MTVLLGNVRIALQVDFGFGDVVTPGLEEGRYPTLLEGLEAPAIRAYPRATAVAEKFEAMVRFGRRNSRMKDFHDLWSLSELYAFDGAELCEAVGRCFESRGTALTQERPDALTSAFYSDDGLLRRWADYRTKAAYRVPPPAAFEVVGERVRTWLGPVWDAVAAKGLLKGNWSGGGPWRNV